MGFSKHRLTTRLSLLLAAEMDRPLDALWLRRRPWLVWGLSLASAVLSCGAPMVMARVLEVPVIVLLPYGFSAQVLLVRSVLILGRTRSLPAFALPVLAVFVCAPFTLVVGRPIVEVFLVLGSVPALILGMIVEFGLRVLPKISAQIDGAGTITSFLAHSMGNPRLAFYLERRPPLRYRLAAIGVMLYLISLTAGGVLLGGWGFFQPDGHHQVQSFVAGIILLIAIPPVPAILGYMVVLAAMGPFVRSRIRSTARESQRQIRLSRRLEGGAAPGQLSIGERMEHGQLSVSDRAGSLSMEREPS